MVAVLLINLLTWYGEMKTRMRGPFREKDGTGCNLFCETLCGNSLCSGIKVRKWHQVQKILGIILSVGVRTIRGRQPSVWKANWKRLYFSSQPLSLSDNVTQNKKWDEAAFAILEMFSKWIGSLTKADRDVDGIVELLKCHVSFATVLSPLPDRLKPIKLKTGTIDHLEWTTLEHADCCWEYECILKQVGSNIVRFPS